MQAFFSGKRVLLASMHGKESAIGPVLQRRMGWTLELATNLNTDQFGTFSGEIPRSGSPLEAARAKVYAALELSGASMAIASEGSFGPHPAIPFIAADHELLLLVDAKKGIEIHASVYSAATNYAQQEIHSWPELESFAQASGFPEHRLILRGGEKLEKGIGDWEALKSTYQELADKEVPIQAETDMRAMYNPMRMAVIAQAAEALADKLQSSCPVCGSPGFEVKSSEPGLPCSLCHIPTSLAKSYTWGCTFCGHTLEKGRPDGLLLADPAHCDWCNP